MKCAPLYRSPSLTVRRFTNVSYLAYFSRTLTPRCYFTPTDTSAWRSRVRWHNLRGRPRHSRRVLQWNGLFVLYDLHLPPAAPLPPEIALPVASDEGGGGGRVAPAAMATQAAAAAERDEAGGGGTVEDRTSACGRGATFRSNGALVSPSGRYTFVQHNGERTVHIMPVEG